MLHDRIQSPISVSEISGISALTDPAPGETGPFVPPALADLLFGQKDAAGAPLNVYAVLDAAKVAFLSDRLTQEGLQHKCLFTGSAAKQFGDAAPWLIQLEPEAKLTRHFFAHDPAEDVPFYLLAKAPGILLRSTLSLDEVFARLRRISQPPDEVGVRFFFRYCEPEFLAAVLSVASMEEIADVCRGIEDFLWLIPSLADDLWDARTLRAEVPPDTPAKPLVMDAAKRQAMQRALNVRQARAMARAHTPLLNQRRARADVYARLMGAGFDNGPWLNTTFDLMSQVPAADHPQIWTYIESGDASLGFINHRIAAHYQLELVLP